MRINDDIGSESLASERHILMTILNTARSLLSVARREFVANLRNTHRSDTNLTELVALAVQRQHHLIDNSRFRVTQKCRRVLLGEALRVSIQLSSNNSNYFHILQFQKRITIYLIVVLRQRNRFANDHIIAGHTNSRRNNTIVVQFVVERITHTLA